ncbi:MAG: hypothetical protein GF341_09770 [candidate division Zixibacteria bacterium]|nr:hypothetical protein [candidate division Zixibacteria bacterium]
MVEQIIDVLRKTVMITGFVAVMMIVIEYGNVCTSGRWRQWLSRRGPTQYLIAAVLGVLPGCLGVFAVVSLFSHGIVSLGALVAAMIATSGDEAFVMLAVIPADALRLAAILLPFGVIVGITVDAVRRRVPVQGIEPCDQLEVHEVDECTHFNRSQIVQQWKDCTLGRGVLCIGLAALLVLYVSGTVGPESWGWLRISLVSVTVFVLIVSATVPDHFLDTHLWEHVVKSHVPKIFLWTFVALLISTWVATLVQMDTIVDYSRILIIVAACLIGIIPESGPHLVIVMLYADGILPFSALLANSIVQDGHGMLPLLAQSRRTFVAVKTVNVACGLAAGLLWELLL